MTNQKIKQLALDSFVKNSLDGKKVNRFSAKMKRKELREYIRAIKLIDLRNKVIIIVPSLNKFRKTDLLQISKIFRGKRIEYKEDPDLLVGVKVIDNDQILNFNLKDRLDNIIESYDN